MAAWIIEVEVHICDQRRSYKATFEGPDAEQHVLDFARTRESTHVVRPWDDETFPWSECSRLFDYWNPICEHQLSARLCYGPDHYPSSDQERLIEIY